MRYRQPAKHNIFHSLFCILFSDMNEEWSMWCQQQTFSKQWALKSISKSERQTFNKLKIVRLEADNQQPTTKLENRFWIWDSDMNIGNGKMGKNGLQNGHCHWPHNRLEENVLCMKMIASRLLLSLHEYWLRNVPHTAFDSLFILISIEPTELWFTLNENRYLHISRWRGEEEEEEKNTSQNWLRHRESEHMHCAICDICAFGMDKRNQNPLNYEYDDSIIMCQMQFWSSAVNYYYSLFIIHNTYMYRHGSHAHVYTMAISIIIIWIKAHNWVIISGHKFRHHNAHTYEGMYGSNWTKVFIHVYSNVAIEWNSLIGGYYYYFFGATNRI